MHSVLVVWSTLGRWEPSVVHVLDDPDGTFVVLVNEDGHHSLWPASFDVPVGWTVACGEGSREAALDYVEQNWVGLRPGNLV
jgi:MbtH protein